ncbi:phosphoribosyl-AMP cyclohydrolase [Aurantimonas sp. Leaf443]|uniref:phosphoribosyl-AMP cyclohydrolase n=1 Tax=Aurantimonas sp. Leaf443 TaxID=1736378 RepID=UPI0006FC3BD2|nr:phosphoribosyl-AMP cyclohydrolase [Aurantimonas sp. Leaf443]KQT82735.1 phosphoribosyl-AMP cyclohydrolase [Aurantimonas sp. Leaf443]
MAGDPFDREEGTCLAPRFDAAGLVTAVVTDAESGALLMVAHMNEEALRLTVETGIAHYWSRSRGTLWKKGETSGALQTVSDLLVDCDQDAIWLKVVPQKRADTCHTGRSTCFYRRIDRESGALEPVADA